MGSAMAEGMDDMLPRSNVDDSSMSMDDDVLGDTGKSLCESIWL